MRVFRIVKKSTTTPIAKLVFSTRDYKRMKPEVLSGIVNDFLGTVGSNLRVTITEDCILFDNQKNVNELLDIVSTKQETTIILNKVEDNSYGMIEVNTKEDFNF